MVDFQEALRSPGSVYKSPEQVLSDPRLDREGKRAILKSWEQDARELAVADEENMSGGESDMLDRVVNALLSLADERGGEGATEPALVSGKAGARASRRHSAAAPRACSVKPKVRH